MSFSISGPEYVYPLKEPYNMPYGFFYGLEIAAVVTITLLGILVNSLLGKKYIFLVLFQHFQKKKEKNAHNAAQMIFFREFFS